MQFHKTLYCYRCGKHTTEYDERDYMVSRYSEGGLLAPTVPLIRVNCDVCGMDHDVKSKYHEYFGNPPARRN